LYSLFDYLADFTSSHPVRLIQVGDLYELWESALVLLFANDDKLVDAFGTIGFERHLLIRYREAIVRDIRRRGLDKVFSAADLKSLERQPWDSPTLKPVWQKMKDAIQRAHRITDVHGQDAGLFKNDGHINADLLDWTHIGGNHDSFISDVTPRAFGTNKAVWVEHGHLRDPKNCPTNVSEGIFWTGANVIAEIKNVGDQAKGLESNRRPLFQGNAASTAENRAFRDKGRPYSVIVNGHTHRSYAALLTVRRDLPRDYEPIAVLYDQGWKELNWKDWVKAVPDIARIVDVALEDVASVALSPLLPLLHICGSIAKYSR
jgi:hypothetical protein